MKLDCLPAPCSLQAQSDGALLEYFGAGILWWWVEGALGAAFQPLEWRTDTAFHSNVAVMLTHHNTASAAPSCSVTTFSASRTSASSGLILQVQTQKAAAKQRSPSLQPAHRQLFG